MDELTKKRLFGTLRNQALPIEHRLPNINEEKNKKSSSINCYDCKFFAITWQKNMPYSCSAYGFKGPQIPSMVVKSTSGNICQLYEPKK